MRLWRSLGTLATAMLLVGTVTVAALATHEDVIAEPIAASTIAVDLETIADGFTTPLWAINAPQDNNRIFVVDQVGKIWAVKVAGGPQIPDKMLFHDVGADGLGLLVELGAFGPGSFDERGLLGLAFHPDYRTNGRLYTYTSEPVAGPADFSTMPDEVEPNHQGVLREWRVRNPRRVTSTVGTAGRVLLRIDEPQFNHNAGAIVFGPDGYLYIAIGDGGAADDQGDGHAVGGNGQDLSDGNVLGKILRIDPNGVNSANGKYGIPADNPFVGSDGADEIFAYGFRNPFRMSFTGSTLIAADVGQNDIEEVDVVVAGGNYGWPVKEGTFLFDMNGDDSGFTTVDSPGVPVGMIDPIAQYDHDEGISIAGGFTYGATDIGALRGSYVFGDFSRSFVPADGRLFHLGSGDEILELVLGSGPLGQYLMGFGQDRRGNIYVLTSDNFAPVGETGMVKKLVSD